MFSSNQVLHISGTLELSDIKAALEFGLVKAARSNSYCFQYLPKVYTYCIGVKYTDTSPEGWTDFQFDFDLDIVARIIKQQLEKAADKFPNIDCEHELGYLMTTADDVICKIENPSFCILAFSPFVNEYSK